MKYEVKERFTYNGDEYEVRMWLEDENVEGIRIKDRIICIQSYNLTTNTEAEDKPHTIRQVDQNDAKKVQHNRKRCPGPTL